MLIKPLLYYGVIYLYARKVNPNITFPRKDLSFITKDGLILRNYYFTQTTT